MQEWFPLYRTMLENSKEFRQLTHTEQVFYVNLVADMNAAQVDGGTFYRADTWYAAALNVTPRKIRQARVKYKKLGLIEYEVGGMKCNRSIATTYKSVRWSVPPAKGDGEQFVMFQRHAFDMVLNMLRKGTIKIEDVVVYSYLTWWRKKYSQNETFVAFKNDFSQVSGVRRFWDSIERLYSIFQYSGGDHLFEYNDRYHKIVLWKWGEPALPSENEGNAKHAARFRQEIEASAHSLSEREKVNWPKRQKKKKPKAAAGELSTQKTRRRVKRRHA